VTRAYLARAREHGGEVHLGAEVTGIEQVGDRWRLSSTTVTVTAPTVVNAAGPWAGEVGKLAGVEVPVEPARRMIWMTAPQEGRATTPLVVDLDSGLYFRSEGERLLFGRSNPQEETGFVTGIDWDFLEPTIEAAMARFPWFADEELDAKASWYGYYELTPTTTRCSGVRRRPRGGSTRPASPATGCSRRRRSGGRSARRSSTAGRTRSTSTRCASAGSGPVTAGTNGT
jgi:sarcosine oxidase, subunit beta